MKKFGKKSTSIWQISAYDGLLHFAQECLKNKIIKKDIWHKVEYYVKMTDKKSGYLSYISVYECPEENTKLIHHFDNV